MNLVQIQMRLIGAREAAAQIKVVGSQMKGLAVSAAASSATAAKSIRSMVPAWSAVAAKGKQMSSFGRSLSTNFAAPFALVAAGSIKMSMDFWKSMRLIQTSAGATEEEMYALGNSVLDLAASGKVKDSPTELSEALYKIVSAGYKGEEAMSVLEKASDLALVSQSDLAATTYALVSAQNTGIRGTKTLGKTIGTLNAIVGGGNMVMGDLTSALSSGILPSAKAAGMSLKDVGAAIDVMTSRGVPASKAANALRLAFSKMATPTGEALDALESIGLSQFQMANSLRSSGGLPATLALLQKHLDKLSANEQNDIITKVFGGAKSGSTMMTLLQNLDDVKLKFDQIGHNAGKIKGDLKDVEDTRGFKLSASLTQLKAAMVRLGDIAGPVLVPILVQLVKWLGGAVKAFSQLPDPVKKFIVLGFAILAFAGPVLMFFGGIIAAIDVLVPVFAALGTAIGVILSPIGLIVIAVVALVAGLVIAYKKVDWFREAVDNTFSDLKKMLAPLANELKAGFEDLSKSAQEMGAELKTTFNDLRPVLEFFGKLFKGGLVLAIKTGIEILKEQFKGLIQTFQGVVQIIRGVVKVFSSLLKGDFRGMWKGIKMIWAGAVNVLIGTIRRITAPVRVVGGLIISFFGKAWNFVKRAAGSAVSWVGQKVMSIPTFIGGVASRIGDVASGMFDGIKSAFKSVLNWVISKWNSFLSALRGVKIELPSIAGIGGGTIGIPGIPSDIPALARGGNFMTRGFALVGDRGPEIAEFPRGARITPLTSRRTAETGALPAQTGSDRAGRDPYIIHTHVYLNKREIALAVQEARDDERALRG